MSALIGERAAINYSNKEIKLRGRAIAGQGLASKHIDCSCDEIKSQTDMQPVPGSLNVVLSYPLILNSESALFFDQNSRYLWQAKIQGRTVWLYRWAYCPLHIVEIISDFNIRNELSIFDGDPVDIVIPSDITIQSKFITNALFFSVWWLREDWFYKRPLYHKNRTVNKIRHLAKDLQKYF